MNFLETLSFLWDMFNFPGCNVTSQAFQGIFVQHDPKIYCTADDNSEDHCWLTIGCWSFSRWIVFFLPRVVCLLGQGCFIERWGPVIESQHLALLFLLHIHCWPSILHAEQNRGISSGFARHWVFWKDSTDQTSGGTVFGCLGYGWWFRNPEQPPGMTKTL